MSTVDIVDPLGPEPEAGSLRPARRPETLAGARIALLDNGKPNAEHVVTTAARGLRDRYGAAEPFAVTKPVASRPIADEALVSFKGFDAAIVGVGD